MLSMATLEAREHRGVGGRVSGRVVRLSRHREVLRMVRFSSGQVDSVMHKSFSRLNGTTSTRMRLERHVDDTRLELFILGRNLDKKTVDVAQRPVGFLEASQAPTAERLNRFTVALDTIPGLPNKMPLFLRWSALGDPVRPAGASDAVVVGRLTLSLPVCVIHD